MSPREIKRLDTHDRQSHSAVLGENHHSVVCNAWALWGLSIWPHEILEEHASGLRFNTVYRFTALSWEFLNENILWWKCNEYSTFWCCGPDLCSGASKLIAPFPYTAFTSSLHVNIVKKTMSLYYYGSNLDLMEPLKEFHRLYFENQ